MTANPPTNSIELIEAQLAKLESSIAEYSKDLCETYDQSKAKFHWASDCFGDEASEFDGLLARELALIHRLMFASAFVVSAASLPSRDIADTPVESTAILDAVTEAGLPPREFLSHYGKYGNQFTWKLLKLTGRISGSSNQPIPDLVEGV